MAGFRAYFRTVTIGWGAGYLVEAAIRLAVVHTASTGVALTVTQTLPYAVAAVLVAWMIGYSRWVQRG